MPSSPSLAARLTELWTVRGACVVGTVIVLASLYLWFVIHYSVNTLYWDDWSVVPLVHAAMHGHLTFSALWAQHNENRILVPNLILVGLGLLSRADTRTVLIVGAALLVVTFLLLLDLYRSYSGRALGVLSVLSLGLVWFSLADFANAMWAYQFAWYLVLFLLVSMLWCLLAVPRVTVTFVLACLAAVAASYSSLQGLFLWPIGVLCLAWMWPEKQHAQRRRASVEMIAWVVSGSVATTVYFLGFVSTGPGHPSTALRHPVEVAKFFLVAVGNVIPIASPTDLFGTEVFGLVLSLAAVVVVVRSVCERRINRRSPLVVALIAFACMFDLSIALGRLSYGVSYALQPRYEMPNLVLLVAVVAYVAAHVPAGHPAQQWKRLGALFERDSWSFLSGLLALIAFMVVVGIVVAQVSTATQHGLTDAKSYNERLTNGARYLVNLDRVPEAQRPCYDTQVLIPGSYPSLAALRPLLLEARQDRLSLFAPGPYRIYRAEGPPLVAQCGVPASAPS